MIISNKGIELLKCLEGAVKVHGRHVIYDDATGRPICPGGGILPPGATIGYGHLIAPEQDFSDGITEEVATELLRSDIAQAEQVVQESVKIHLMQNQYDALVLLVFNIGGGNFRKSTVLRYINNPKYRSVKYPTLSDAWQAWNRCRGQVVPGLTRRRQCELNIYYGK